MPRPAPLRSRASCSSGLRPPPSARLTVPAAAAIDYTRDELSGTYDVAFDAVGKSSFSKCNGTFSFDRIADAHALVDAGHKRGAVVVERRRKESRNTTATSRL